MTEQSAVLCIGAMLWDVIGQSFEEISPGADMPGSIAQLPGGVAFNVAISLTRMDQPAQILAAVGRDSAGDVLVDEAARLGIGTQYVYYNDSMTTDCYVAIESPQGLFAAVADARCLETAGTQVLAPLRDGRLGTRTAPFRGQIMLDGNLTTAALAEIAQDPCFSAADLRVVPASPQKAERLAPLCKRPNTCFYLNRQEAEMLLGRSCPDTQTAAQSIIDLGAARVIITEGPHPVVELRRGQSPTTSIPPKVEILRTTGAGDRFMAAHLVADMRGDSAQDALDFAVAAAAALVSGQTIL